MISRRLVTTGLLAAPFVTRARAAERFPSRSIRFVCGYLPGGTTDIICRIVAERLGPIMGQNIVVENRTGASGLIGAEAVARSAPDGYTVFQNSLAMQTIMPQLPGQVMTVDTTKELFPLANLGGVYNTLVVSSKASFKDVPALIAYARENPGKLTFGSAGIGTTHHLAGELFMHLAGVDMLHVPYRGGPAAILDITAGRCDMMFGNLPELIGFIREGTLRPLAFGSMRASPLFPDVPLMSIYLPEFQFSNWFGMAGPQGLPREVVSGWSDALLTLAKDEDLDRRFTDSGIENLIGTREEFQATIRKDWDRWGELIRSAKIRAG